MGKLAMYGAMAGAGEGLIQRANNKEAAKASEIDDARERRLLALKQRHSAKMLEKQASLNSQENVRDQSQDQEFAGSESELQRAHEIKMLEMKNSAAASNASLRASNSSKTTKSPWKISSTKRAVTGPDGFSEEPVTTITHERTGATYEQKGNMFVPQGVNVDSKPKPKDRQKAERWIVENPENEDAFVEAFGYLPSAFFRQAEMQTTRTSQPAD